jgi:hypothetical protein
VLAQAVKVPAAVEPGGGFDPSAAGSGYQVRAGMSISAIDIYKGTRVLRVADADCAQQDRVVTAQELLLHAADFGRLAALRDQAAFLDSKASTLEVAATSMEQRFAAKTITLAEVEDVRTRVAAINRSRAQIGGEIDRLTAEGVEEYHGAVSDLIRTLEATAMSYEREVTHVRSLDAWDVSLTGGYIPPALSYHQSDYFALLQVSYSLGGPWHTAHDSRYLDAREEEMRSARYELRRELEVMRARTKATAAQSRRELEIVEKRVAELTSSRSAFEGSDASAAPSARTRLDVELVATEADRVFLTGLIRELARLEEK